MKPPQTGLATSCRVQFGGRRAALVTEGGGCALKIAIPQLDSGPPAEEWLLSGADGPVMTSGCALFRTASCLAGITVAHDEVGLERAAGDLYRRVFEIVGKLHLYRVWNYVPRINAAGDGGLENYRLFCRGRSIAFEEYFGRGFQSQLPAASAVGAANGPLAIGFLAGKSVPHHFENPRQVPAFEYPRDYGPRSPSFARATVATTDSGRQVFVSGTAAIRGHASVGVGNLAAQIDCTVENLNLIGDTAGAGPGCGASAGWRRSFKVYVRNRADFAAVRDRLDQIFFRPDDVVNYLHADICRADLLLEIDAVLTAT